jgi:hypothetical protein
MSKPRFKTKISRLVLDLVHIYSSNPQRSTMVYITESYSSGIHPIHFRIEHKSNKYLFFGIINSLE